MRVGQVEIIYQLYNIPQYHPTGMMPGGRGLGSWPLHSTIYLKCSQFQPCINDFAEVAGTLGKHRQGMTRTIERGAGVEPRKSPGQQLNMVFHWLRVRWGCRIEMKERLQNSGMFASLAKRRIKTQILFKMEDSSHKARFRASNEVRSHV